MRQRQGDAGAGPLAGGGIATRGTESQLRAQLEALLCNQATSSYVRELMSTMGPRMRNTGGP